MICTYVGYMGVVWVKCVICMECVWCTVIWLMDVVYCDVYCFPSISTCHSAVHCSLVCVWFIYFIYYRIAGNFHRSKISQMTPKMKILG